MKRFATTAVAASLLALPAATALGGNPTFQEIAQSLGVAALHSTSGFVHANYTGGGAVGDFNNDGCQDIFVISGGVGDRPDRLYINNCDGTFTEEGEAWGFTPHLGKGASVADYNNDGWLDIYVTSAGPVGNAQPGQHKLFRNNGDGTFTNVAATAHLSTTSPGQEDGYGIGWGDYDLDGDLDVFVGGFASNNAGSRFFRNNGDGTFTDITAAIEFWFGVPFTLACLTPRFVDMDGDWYPDLLLVSDFGTSRYYRNDADGFFTDMTAAAGAGQEENGMGQTIGDFNNDGLLDWYVTSIYFPSISWTGDKLYINNGNHSYTQTASTAGVADGGYGWATLAVDFNHDGLLDIAETNGDGAGSGTFYNEQSYLWVQNANGTFTEMALATGFSHFGKGRGMVNLDYDNDGDEDVMLFANNERPYFFRNDISGADANWFRVFLNTSNSPGLAPNGIGSRVTVTAGGKSQLRYIDGSNSYLSYSEMSAHFGLGTTTVVDELRIDWPDQTSTILTNLAANQTLTVAPGAGTPGDINYDGVVNTADFILLLISWGPCPDPCPPSCPADLNGDCTVSTADFNMLLSNWG